jgi:hypothetical protein
MPKLYVISEIGWEYDDNRYFTGEFGGGHPKKAFKSRAKALEYCQQQNILKFKGSFEEIRDFGWNRQSILSNENPTKVEKTFLRLFNTTSEEWYEDTSVDFAIRPTEEDWDKLYRCFNIAFYDIAELEIDE